MKGGGCFLGGGGFLKGGGLLLGGGGLLVLAGGGGSGEDGLLLGDLGGGGGAAGTKNEEGMAKSGGRNLVSQFGPLNPKLHTQVPSKQRPPPSAEEQGLVEEGQAKVMQYSLTLLGQMDSPP